MTSPAAIRCATSGAKMWTRPAYSTASSAMSCGKRLTVLAREVLDALGFEAPEDLVRPVRHLRWEPCQPRHVDAVGGGLGALLDPVQKDDLAAYLLDGGLLVATAREEVGKPRQLVVVGGKERQRLHVVVEVLRYSPREAHPIVGRG